ncbi:DUF6907 domain-containing protein [Phytohabitans kaempferiae]|uniref:DUF6907 domain-containing protein n=1 Tax=Phytohabitans kaempferiae TaxID=1620943 RepID=A0ABV6LZF6_9ACTN
MRNLPCPAWCTVDHDDHLDAEAMVQSRSHYGDILRIPAVPGEHGHSEVTVDLCAVDDFETGRRSSTDISVSGLDPAPPAIVRQVMAALELALRLAEAD